jgi:hypothetical protein
VIELDGRYLGAYHIDAVMPILLGRGRIVLQEEPPGLYLLELGHIFVLLFEIAVVLLFLFGEGGAAETAETVQEV